MFSKSAFRFAALGAALIATGALVAGSSAAAGEASPQAEEAKKAPFVLKVQTPDGVTVGKHADVVVTIKAKKGFKINKGYPAKLKLADTDGVTYDKKVLRKGDAKLEDGGHTMVFSVGYVQNKKGDAALQGKLKFSVCSASQCMMERETIKATLKAK